ncbi:MAG: S-layer protein, partial [Hansschlegelia sp.]
ATEADAAALARWLAEVVTRRVADAAAVVLSRPGAPRTPVVFGAGVGRFLARRLAERLGLLYRDVGAEWSDDPALTAAAADCAPAVAVALLFQARSAAARGGTV